MSQQFKDVTASLLVTLLCVLAPPAYTERVRYENYRVYKVQPQTLPQMETLKSLDGASREAYIFLEDVYKMGVGINVLVAPRNVTNFLVQLQSTGVNYQLLEENAQMQLETELEKETVADPNHRAAEYTWTTYHTLDDTYKWLHTLAKEYRTRMSIFEAGKSFEGRRILGARISYSPNNKRSIFIEGGMHAREWISPATTTYILHQLLTSKSRDVRAVAEQFDWYFVPHTNPDGYVYTHTTDRLWRKTRTPYGSGCYGADPNRNWDFHWREVGASDKPCSDTYAGPKAFSERETQTLSKFIRTIKDELFLYVSFHSYSQLLLFPYGHTSERPPNYKDLKRIFDVAIKAMARRYGTKYTGGNIYDAIYPASGSTVDWAYGQLNVKYSYCYELRPRNTNFWTGFMLPANQIIPTGEETLDSLMAMIKEANATAKAI